MPVNIHGKSYLPVAERMTLLKEEIGIANYSMQSEILYHDTEKVIVKAVLTINHGETSQSYIGHAEEHRNASKINKTSALENAETSAVGRALAFAGWAGDEIASADEVAAAISQQPAQQPTQLPRSRQPAQQPQQPAQQPEQPTAAPAPAGPSAYAGGEVDKDLWGKAKEADQKAAYGVLNDISKKAGISKGLNATGELAEECNLRLAQIIMPGAVPQQAGGDPNDDIPF